MRRAIYIPDEALPWMSSETFNSLDLQGSDGPDSRQKWDHIWRCLFGNYDSVPEPGEP